MKKREHLFFYWIGVVIGIMITIPPTYNISYKKGLAMGREIYQKEPQHVYLYCLTKENVWGRCLQKDGKFLVASGTEAEQIRFYWDYIQKENKNGR